jgi:hypothetical protein
MMVTPFGNPMTELLDQGGLKRFYATLSRRQREQAIDGGLPLSDLDRDSQPYLNQLLLAATRSSSRMFSLRFRLAPARLRFGPELPWNPPSPWPGASPRTRTLRLSYRTQAGPHTPR